MAKTFPIKTPTDADYASFDGMHCGGLWASLSHTWACPSCGRTKRQLMRWGEIGGETMRKMYGPINWKINMARHYDEGRRGFGDTVLCGECRWAQNSVKTKFSLPQLWNFSPAEIGSFTKTIVNGAIEKIDYEKAHSIYLDESRRRNQGLNSTTSSPALARSPSPPSTIAPKQEAEIALLPCPFCAKPPQTKKSGIEVHGRPGWFLSHSFAIACGSCGVELKRSGKVATETQSAAVSAWNSRAYQS